MPLTPETLPRHELNGLPVRVVDSDDESRVGLEGRVVVETTKTLSVEVRENGTSRVLTVPKSGSVFEFAITDDAADFEKESGTAFKLADSKPDSDANSRADSECAGENVAYVTVDGSRLLSQPARRTETNGDSPWQ
ncbi:ribonuclease P protein component 1 [Natrarchaeobaculum sulfurireducens]|uniref:Ribonuclease P protein component 1 n=1 Tax=Natrarchaeobaculum sulfurireducens TaxID=2044521 RepID=A0A346PDN6_9EURY|nr:ribonuclease P protein component 1 [Natrarchaeobaculum sulfurireducens]AXR77631.1 RNase P/RNase MRP subunit p29 [Natrarchaeobaculum sulfurireducens]AXR82392.1 Ribonuclease P protein component 1 [Natrarchaeobaculum sulfurireducens]